MVQQLQLLHDSDRGHHLSSPLATADIGNSQADPFIAVIATIDNPPIEAIEVEKDWALSKYDYIYEGVINYDAFICHLCHFGHILLMDDTFNMAKPEFGGLDIGSIKLLTVMQPQKEAKYLGLWFEESEEWTTHAKERITKAKQALNSLRQRGAIAQGLGTRTAQITAEAIVKTVAGVCRAQLGWLTIMAYCELERQAVIRHAERQDGHFEALEEISQAREEEGEKKEGEGGEGTSDVEKKVKRIRTLTQVAKVEYAAEGERGTRAWL
ncbi:hypothetical protein QOT17_012239 [Balamuthia mandrillaris]